MCDQCIKCKCEMAKKVKDKPVKPKEEVKTRGENGPGKPPKR